MKILSTLCILLLPLNSLAGALAVYDIQAVTKLANQIEIANDTYKTIKEQVDYMQSMKESMEGKYNTYKDMYKTIRDMESVTNYVKQEIIPQGILPNNEAVRYGNYEDMLKFTKILNDPSNAHLKKWLGQKNVETLMARSLSNINTSYSNEIKELVKGIGKSTSIGEKQDLTNYLLQKIAEMLNELLVTQAQTNYALLEEKSNGVNPELENDPLKLPSWERWGMAAKYLTLDKEIECTSLLRETNDC
jgi:hypothetical protein